MALSMALSMTETRLGAAMPGPIVDVMFTSVGVTRATGTLPAYAAPARLDTGARG
jgi:hypothetical protein